VAANILVIENDSDSLSVLIRLLSHRGFPTTGRKSGRSALDLLRSRSFDLVITESRLPDIRGVHLLQQIKSIDELTQVIVLSAGKEVNDAIEMLRGDGAFDYLIKPLTRPERLLESIERALQKRKRLHQLQDYQDRLQDLEARFNRRIQDLVHQQEVLRESERRFRLISELVSDFFYIMRVDNRKGVQFEWVDGAFNRITGFKPHELPGFDDWLKRVEPDDRIRLKNPIRQGAKSRLCTEYRFRARDGSIRWLSDISYRFYDRKLGRFTEIIGAVRDITDLKEASEQTEKNQKLRDFALSAGRVYIWNYEIRRNRLLLDAKLMKFLGYIQDGTYRGMNKCAAIFYPEDYHSYTRNLHQLIKRGKGFFEGNYRLVDHSGGIHWYLVRARFCDRPGGHESRVLGTLTDITDFRLAGEQYGRSIKMETISRIAGGIAHEFNNSLAIITLALELFKKDIRNHPDLEKEILKGLEPVETATQRLHALSSKLLSYSRIGKHNPRPIQLDSLVRKTVEEFHPPPDKQTRIEVENLNPGIQIWADTIQLKRALRSIFQNAVESINHEGRIKIKLDKVFPSVPPVPGVTTFEPGMYGLVQIEDNGIGIDSDSLEKVFEPFYSTKSPGRGLGLSAAYGIVKKHNGWISVDSIPGKGTTVKLYFPVRDENPLVN